MALEQRVSCSISAVSDYVSNSISNVWVCLQSWSERRAPYGLRRYHMTGSSRISVVGGGRAHMPARRPNKGQYGTYVYWRRWTIPGQDQGMATPWRDGWKDRTETWPPRGGIVEAMRRQGQTCIGGSTKIGLRSNPTDVDFGSHVITYLFQLFHFVRLIDLNLILIRIYGTIDLRHIFHVGSKVEVQLV